MEQFLRYMSPMGHGSAPPVLIYAAFLYFVPFCSLAYFDMEMKEGILELLLVSAEGLKHAHHLGTQRHYVTIQFGDRILTSKITQESSLKSLFRVHVGDIIREGAKREFLQMKPAPYNIVLKDGKYKGELKLGVKFLSNVSLEHLEQCAVPPRQTSVAYRPFLNITLPDIPWRRFFFFCTRSDSEGSRRNS
ncbi:hypothetical protein GUJ93_ZPchr0012g18783 [Zizania palustris]|uniref:Uncharacterized protein n=1 Tax=Zizania palustris TaxID=103762 RepID=A0A8J6BUY7_ZIZPA|nr:hypothetical protein GUJ93_ZPchr0012g18783 [Zizania palustris]